MTENKDFCHVGMHSKENIILELNQYPKSTKASAIFIEKVDGCQINPEKSSTAEVCGHIL